MTIQIPNDHRRIIPRWRNSWVAISTGELEYSQVKRINTFVEDRNINIKIQEWLEHPSLETASELVSAGISQGRVNESLEAARFILDNRDNTTKAVLSLAEEIINRGENKKIERSIQNFFEISQLYNKIHLLRNSLIAYPRNPLRWVDLARAYAVIGQWKKSNEAMRNALILAPINRFVLRSATRLYIHLDEPDRAYHLISKKELVQNDPWLLAAEIATSTITGKTSKFVKNSREVLSQGDYHPFHTAELSSALATIELFSGSAKKARKLFQASLESPTENSVAQSAWAKRWLPSLEINNAIELTPRTYEAQAWNSYLAYDWRGVFAASMDWLLDEPFSSRPAELGSYAAAIGLEDFDLSISITKNGLIANPNDHGLINNHAYALASQNKVFEASKILSTASRPAPNKATEVALLATEGLIKLKLGQVIEGQAKYLDAISLAKKENLTKIATIAAIHYAIEMVKINQLSFSDAISFAEKATSQYMDIDVQWLKKKLLSMNDKLVFN